MLKTLIVSKTDDSEALIFIDKIYQISEFYDDYFKKTLVRIYFENGKSLDIKNSLKETLEKLYEPITLIDKGLNL